MTTEERLTRLEETDRKLSELMVEVIGLVHRQDERLERQQEQIQLQQEQIQLQRQDIRQQKELLDEVRQDTEMTRRLWVRLATKHGWLDDDDLNGDGA